MGQHIQHAEIANRNTPVVNSCSDRWRPARHAARGRPGLKQMDATHRTLITSHLLDNLVRLLDIAMIPGLEAVSLHKGSPATVRLDDLTFRWLEGGLLSTSASATLSYPRIRLYEYLTHETVCGRHVGAFVG